jgi:hypothetical protein
MGHTNGSKHFWCEYKYNTETWKVVLIYNWSVTYLTACYNSQSEVSDMWQNRYTINPKQSYMKADSECLKQTKYLITRNKNSIHLLLDRLCGLVVRVPGYRSRVSGFESWCYQIIWEVVDPERVSLSFLRILGKLLKRESSLENRD